VTLPASIEGAIRDCHAAGARIVNFSIGNDRAVFSGSKSTALAAIIDQLCRELNMLIVVPTGNSWPQDYVDLSSPSDEYTLQLLESEQTRLIDPAPAAIALTVGGIADRDLTDLRYRPLGRRGWPSPFTRRGPGIQSAVKPELVAPAGARALDLASGTMIDDQELGVLCARGGAASEGLFASSAGTSLAVPRVANVAATVLRHNPGISANMLRALVIQSAQPTSADYPLPEGKPAEQKAARRSLEGYGVADPIRAAFSDEHRTVLVAEDKIPMDAIHLYNVPIPPTFFESGGQRGLTIALAYDPPVRAKRYDYVASKMDFDLLRGVDPNEVEALFIAAATGDDDDNDEKVEKLSGTDVIGETAPVDRNSGQAVRTKLADLSATERPKLHPSRTVRSVGVNQRASKTFHQRLRPEDGAEFQIVVRNVNRWDTPDRLQAYGLTVTLWRSSAHRTLYTDLRARIELGVEFELDSEIEIELDVHQEVQAELHLDF